MNIPTHRVLRALRGVTVFVFFVATEASAQTPQREISNITGDLYRFRSGGHFSVFLVTPSGIIATDPIDKDAAAWLESELTARFKQPVKYVIYSHGHADHATGGEVFSDTATFVAHEATRAAIQADRVQTPLPTETFKETKTIELGGSTVELRYVGRNHGDGMIVMRFPKERVLFAVDLIPVKSVAWRDFPGAFFPDWLDSLTRVEALDFDILVPGHGSIGTKDDVRLHREYLEDLRTQVARFIKEGKSVDETKKLVNLAKYRGWDGYADMRDLNIQGMYGLLTTR